MSVAPVKLERDDVKRLDELVKVGLFKSRSQAIRSLLREQLEKRIESIPQVDLSGVDPVLDLMLKLASKGNQVVRITSKNGCRNCDRRQTQSMKTVYLDTNVILSPYHREDPF